MIVYATSAEFAAAYPSVPAATDVLLKQASLMVRRGTLTAVYATDALGLPTDPDTREQFRAATLAQVAYWNKAGIDPISGTLPEAAAVKSVSSGGQSVSFDSSAEQAQQKSSLTSLVPAASAFLLGLAAPVQTC